MSLGDSRVDVDLNPSGSPRIANIKRRTVDPIDAVEATGGENPSSKIARLKALAKTGVEASTARASKAATRSGHRTTRIVTYRRLVAPAPSGEVQHASSAVPHDCCPPPRDPNPTRRRVELGTKTASRHSPSISLPRHVGPTRGPDAAARWRRPAGPLARRDEAPPASDSTPLRGSLSCPQERLETSRPQASPCHARPPNTAAPQYPCKLAPGPPHAPPQFARAERSSTPRTPLQDPKVPLTRPSPHAQTRQRCPCSPCAPRAACTAASALQLQHLVARPQHNRGIRLSD